MKRLAFGFLVVLALACAQGWAVEPGTVGAIVQEAFPEAEVKITGETDGFFEGVLTDKKGADPFRITVSEPFEREGSDYVTMVMAFPFKEESAVGDYLSGKELDLPGHKPVLISARTEAPHEVRWVTLDDRAAASEYGYDIAEAIEDHLMDGTMQVAMPGASYYLLKDPREVIQAGWYTVYRVPELDLCFRKLLFRMVYSENAEMEGSDICQVRFEGSAKEEGRRIVVLGEGGEKLNVLPVKEGKVDFADERPWEREKVKVEKRRSKGRKTARLRVLDETGAPVVGVKVRGDYSVPGRGLWDEGHIEKFEGKTDASGRFSIQVKGYTSIRLYAPGYYHQKESFSWDDFPEGEQVVVLEKEPAGVPMYQSRLQKDWRTDQEEYGYGVRFVDTYRVGSRVSIAKSRDEADMWVVATKIGEPKSEGIVTEDEWLRLFRLSIECRNGWELAVAHGESRKADIREAPAKADYVKRMEGVALGFPTLFYLRKDGGERYGKVYAQFTDTSGRDIVIRTLRIVYAVQAKNVGSRDLKPAKRKP